jgi:flagellin-specific chaperone FliS
MKIYRIALLEDDMEKVYDGLNDALKSLEKNDMSGTKNKIKKAIKKLEEMKPFLKIKDRPTPSGYVRKK